MSEPTPRTWRVIVAGDRRLRDYDLVRDTLDLMLVRLLPNVVILSGAAPGADALGERYAEERGLICERFPADWAKYGRAAGPLRNRQMARADAWACVLFDGSGAGSRSMRQEAQEAGLAIRVVDVRSLLRDKKGTAS